MRNWLRTNWKNLLIVVLVLAFLALWLGKNFKIVSKDSSISVPQNQVAVELTNPTPTVTPESEKVTPQPTTTPKPEVTTKPVVQTKEETQPKKVESQPKTDTTTAKTTTQPKTTTKPTATPALTATPTHTRVTTGSGKTLAFKKGDTVCGYRITIGNQYFENKAIVNSPVDGTVTDGVIWPAQDEIKNLQVVNPLTDKFDGHVRIATGAGTTLTFKKGDTVYGAKIEVNGSVVYQNVCIVNAPADGKVTDGVIWPWEDEIKNVQIIKFQ